MALGEHQCNQARKPSSNRSVLLGSLLPQLVSSLAFIVTAPTHHSSASSTC